MKQQVINYEFDILHNELIQKCPAHRSTESYRYKNWKLPQTINFLMSYYSNHELKWIGNSQGSWILAYFYALLRVCMQKEEFMVKFKYSLYKMCQYCLNLSEQKLLIQLLNIIQKEKPILASFLSRNPELEDLLLNIFQSSFKTNRTDDCFKTLLNYTKNNFHFVDLLQHPTLGNVLEITHKDIYNTIYIIKEYDCFFILDVAKQKSGFVHPPKIREGLTFQDNEEEQTLIIHPGHGPSVHPVRQTIHQKQLITKGKNFVDPKLAYLKQKYVKERPEQGVRIGQKEFIQMRNHAGNKASHKPYFLKKKQQESKKKEYNHNSRTNSPRIEGSKRAMSNNEKNQMKEHHISVLKPTKIKYSPEEGSHLEKVLSATKLQKNQGYKYPHQNILQNCPKNDFQKLMTPDNLCSRKHLLESEGPETEEPSLITPFLNTLI